eukprot:Phypoly_transcript_02613.p1 GENE.Phypoly_transcript_02613~~Phypoly_transcript_02613.p1  ORF type:complete len:724 (+),score=92.05 Phypoly_transcript_02613:248-2419(+)
MSTSTSAVNTSNLNNRPPSKNWEFGSMLIPGKPNRTTSQPTLRPSGLNKLHLAIARKDLTKLRARLAQPKKAKAELVEFDHMEQTPLTAALRLNLVDFVRDLLEFYKQTRSDINQQDKTGCSALHLAASYCDDQILMILLNYDGIDVNLPNGDLNTPLHYFCQKFKSPNCQEPFQLFLKRGVDVNTRNKYRETPLHKSIFNNSVRLLMVNLLLEAGADVNLLSTRGESCLHFAVHLGREDLVSVLIKAGADITIRGTEGKTAYELAMQGNNSNVTNILRQVQDIYDWLSSLGLEMYWKVFVREEMTKDILPELTEQVLDKMGITAVGHRMKILKSCSQIKLNTPSSITSPTPSTPSSMHSSAGTSSPSTPSTQHRLNPFLEKSSNHHSAAAVCADGSISSDAVKKTLSNLEHIKTNPNQWVIDSSELEYTLKLGSGSSGKVYKGIYKTKEVAVKVLKAMTTQSQLEEFKKEFQIMCAIRSPYMVTFYGAALEPKLCMVIEFCSRDSLYHVMNRTTPAPYDIGWDKFFRFSLQMTRGMECLHNWTPSIVHRDFKSLNLLINEAWDCKVSDFGLSRFNTAENLDTLSQIRGTFAYCAPEVATGSGVPYTVKSDVYSIGIVLWELATRVVTGEYHRPFSEFPNIKMDFQIMLNSKDGVRPTLPPQTPQSLREVYLSCVAQSPTDRPTCTQLVQSLVKIEADYLANPLEWESKRAKPQVPPPTPTIS